MNHASIARKLFDNDIRMDRITWLAGAILGVSDDDFIEDVVLDAADGVDYMHTSMAVFRGMPDWAKDRDGFAGWIAQNDLFGFVVEVRTPKPIKFHDADSYTTLSFGYSAGTYIYVTDLNDALPLAVKWREERMQAWRAEVEAA